MRIKNVARFYFYICRKLNAMTCKFPSTFTFLSLVVLVLYGCKKNTPEPIIEPITEKNVSFSMNHFWNDENEPFVMGQDYTHPQTNENFNFQTCNYYLSNFQLRKKNGEWWSHPHSYFLVRISNNNQYQFDLSDVPLGEYDALRFLVGVDSTKNVSGAQAGDLAPSNAMFWSWSTGYIMIKLEGNSPQANWEFFSFHIGGFRKSDDSDVTRWKEIEFNQNNLFVKADNSPKVNLNVDIAKTWSTQNTLATYNSLHAPNAVGQLMADQFLSGLSLKNVE
jgi:hypothetical protein